MLSSNSDGAQGKLFDCTDENNQPNKVGLIFVPYTAQAICETPGNFPKAWYRQGYQNMPADDNLREQIKREKGIVKFEDGDCCLFEAADLDEGILSVFRQNYLREANHARSVEEMLYQAGALNKTTSGYVFNNAGFLFFAANPQRRLAWAYARLLRFEVNESQRENRGTSTFDHPFTGSLVKQISDARLFFKETGFFKTYHRRKPEGGFIEEAEYPLNAVDEAVVNAIAHRDYAVQRPIECEAYKDAFIVRNAGRVQQREHDVPPEFSLAEKRLDSDPRNPKLIKWLQLMRDENGAPFVRGLGEGTRTMRVEMESLNLPAPMYKVTPAQTTVTLFNNAEEREALIRSAYVEQPTEFANLFPLEIKNFGNLRELPVSSFNIQREFQQALKDALEAKGWYVDSMKFGRVTAHRKRQNISLPPQVESIVRFFPAYSFQMRSYLDVNYLCVDYTLEVKNVLNVAALLKITAAPEIIGKVATVNWNGWKLGRILEANGEWSQIHLFDYKQNVKIESDKVIPHLPKAEIGSLLQRKGIRFDLNQAIKQYSLATEPSAARTRFEKTQAVVEHLSQTVFPLMFSGLRIRLRTAPAPLYRTTNEDGSLTAHSLTEPNVEFGNGQTIADIREGITRYGAYSEEEKMIEIVPLCLTEMREGMASLIERLKAGKYKYKGSERTFHARFTYNSVITFPRIEEALSNCQRLIIEHREWSGDTKLNRLLLIHVPEQGYALDDEGSPYYKLKRFSLEQGIPCQMVDTPTLVNPDWKDLNLALNIVAKCGVTPWVLPNAIPDADFFVGLSYTENRRRQGDARHMGYANVFTKFGKWVFYSGNTNTFDYEERARYFHELVRETLERLTLTETPNIYFHYSAKFSRQDRESILEAARSIRPQGTYYFVWINTSHNVRLYDSRVETDGSLSRGSYVVTSPNQFYLSTTGYNPYRKALGTPQMLEVNVWVERPAGAPIPPPDVRSIALQILSLTKLNWASTDSLCGEPITTKYAHDIAYLTSAFLRQGSAFSLHEVLEHTPWFI